MEGEEEGMTKYDAYLNALSLVIMGYMGLRGVYFLIADQGIFDSADTYDLMQSLVPKDAWGVMFLAAALLLLITILNEDKPQYFFAMGGGLFSTLLLFLYSLASFDTDPTAVLPYSYLMFAGFSVAITVLGVLAWKERD